MCRFVAMAALAFALVGCGTLKRTFNGDIYRVDRPWFDSRTERLTKEDCDEVQIDLAAYCFPDRTERSDAKAKNVRCTDSINILIPACKDGTTAYEAAVYSAAARDALQDKLIELSNNECSKHKAAIFGTNTGANVIMSTLSSLLSGAATGFAAQTTKTALAAGSTFVIAAQAHYNEQVYRQMFVGTIIKAVDDDRTARLAEIYDHRRYPVPFLTADPRATGHALGAGFATQRDRNFRVPSTKEPPPVIESPFDDAFVRLFLQPSVDRRISYSVEEAVRDVADYHDRCSFYNGLIRVAAAVQAFSPCDIMQARRDRLLAELGAIRTAGEQDGNFRERFTSFSAELKTLETKLQSCGQATATR
jgi:hypothetical protein